MFVHGISKEAGIKMHCIIFANSFTFQTCACLQPFMVCMSAPSTPRIIDVMVDNYNAEVISWTDDLRKHFEVCSYPVFMCNINFLKIYSLNPILVACLHNHGMTCLMKKCMMNQMLSDASPEWERFDFNRVHVCTHA